MKNASQRCLKGPTPEEEQAAQGEGLAALARAGLATLPRPVVLRHIADELEHGSSFSRYVVLAEPQRVHNWTGDLTPFRQGLVAASRDENTVVASEAIRGLEQYDWRKLGWNDAGFRRFIAPTLDKLSSPELKKAAQEGILGMFPE